jgi:hypothetical protein
MAETPAPYPKSGVQYKLILFLVTLTLTFIIIITLT